MNALFTRKPKDTAHLLWKEPARGPYSDWPKAWTKQWWTRTTWLIGILTFIAMTIVIIALTLPDLSAK